MERDSSYQERFKIVTCASYRRSEELLHHRIGVFGGCMGDTKVLILSVRTTGLHRAHGPYPLEGHI